MQLHQIIRFLGSLLPIIRAAQDVELANDSVVGGPIEYKNLVIDVALDEPSVIRADLLHMFLTLGTSMWKIPQPVEIASEVFVDADVHGSEIALVNQPGAILSSQDLLWAVHMSISVTFSDVQSLTSPIILLPLIKICASSEGLVIAQLTPTIAAPGVSAGLNDSMSTSTLAALNITNNLKTTTSLETNISFRLMITRTGRSLDFHPIHQLFYTMIRQLAWSHEYNSPLSTRYRSNDHCASKEKEGVSVEMCFETLNQSGKRARFRDLDAVIRALVIDPALRLAPESLAVSAYLLNDRGQRLPQKFLKITLDRTAALAARINGERPQNSTPQLSEPQYMGSGVIEIVA